MPCLDEGFTPCESYLHLRRSCHARSHMGMGCFRRCLYYFCFFSVSVKSSWVSWVHYVCCISASNCFMVVSIQYLEFWFFVLGFFFFWYNEIYYFLCVNWYYMYILISTFSSTMQIPSNGFCLCQHKTREGACIKLK